MTFEEAKKILSESSYQVGINDYSILAIQLMKADALQRQAEAINELKNLISDCVTKTSYTGAKVFTIRIDGK